MSRVKVLVFGLLLILILISGCEPRRKVLEGVDVPEYEVLLDVEPWIEPFKFNPADLDRKQKEVWDTIDESIGILDWKQKKISAKSKDGIVRVYSTTGFKGSSSSLAGELIDVKAVEGSLLQGISKKNLAVAYSIGNPKGYFKSSMKWLIDGKRFNDILRETGGKDAVLMWAFGIKMTIRGYRDEIEKKVMPYIGDEIVFAFYLEDEEISEDELSEYQPYSYPEEKSLIAISLKKKGLGEKLPEILEDLFQVSVSMFSKEGSIRKGMQDFNIADGIKKIPQGGYDIYTSSAAYGMEMAWAEYEGVLFFSDEETLTQLKELVNLPVKGDPDIDSYNLHLWFNLDITGQDLLESLSYMDITGSMYNMDESTMGITGEIEEYIESGGKLGILEFIVRNKGNGVDTELIMSHKAAPFLLKMHQVLLESWGESMEGVVKELDYADRGNMFDWMP